MMMMTTYTKKTKVDLIKTDLQVLLLL